MLRSASASSTSLSVTSILTPTPVGDRCSHREQRRGSRSTARRPREIDAVVDALFALWIPENLLAKLIHPLNILRVDVGPPLAAEGLFFCRKAEREQAERMAEVAKALGDPVRMQLVDVLRKHAGKVCVCELVPLFDLSQPTVSHHLKVLREAGIVGSEREGPLGLLLRQARGIGGTERMAELETVETEASSCCTPAAQETCCEPDAKAECCGEHHGAGCGCSAGQATEAADVRELVRERYGAAAVAASTGRSSLVLRQRRRSHRRAARRVRLRPLRDRRARGAARGSPARIVGLWQPHRPRGSSCPRGKPSSISVRVVGSTSSCQLAASDPTGKAYGLDMTDEMLGLARRNQAEAGVENVEFLRGTIEADPAAQPTPST